MLIVIAQRLDVILGSGIYDSQGTTLDKPSRRIILNADIVAARNAIKISGTASDIIIDNSNLVGGIESGYHAVDIATNYVESVLISSKIRTLLGDYNIYFSSNTAQTLGLVVINDCVLNGSTKSHIRFATPASVAGIRIRDNTFESGLTFDVNINNASLWSVISENYKSDGAVATLNGS